MTETPLVDKREHETTPDCWCKPKLDYIDPNTGAKVWVHNCGKASDDAEIPNVMSRANPAR